MGTAVGEQTVARQAADYLKTKYAKPGNAFVGVVSRLDRLVSGVLVLARTSKAASRLSEQFREQSIRKFYLAVVEGTWPAPPAALGPWQELTDWVLKDERAQRMQVAFEPHPAAQLARLRVRCLACAPHKSLVQVELLTGRKHQIRLQLAERGLPIWGDSKYGARSRSGQAIALHCQQITLVHPTLKQTMTFHSSARRHWPHQPTEFQPWLDRPATSD